MTYSDHYTESHALVIGIGQYDDPRFPPLPGAVRDAQAVADILCSDLYGFKIKPLLNEDATKSAIHDALNDLQALDPDSRVVVYFAGHGENIKDRFGRESGVIFTYDSRKANRYTWLPLDEVTGLIGYASAKHILFIFDSCFSGKALRLTNLRSTADRYIEKAAYQVLTGGAVEVVADDRSMTQMLLPLLKKSDDPNPIRLTMLYLRLQDIMERERCVQIPQAGHLDGSQGGDFVFYIPSIQSVWDVLPAELSYVTHTDVGVRLMALDRVPAYLGDPAVADALRLALNERLIDEPDRRVRARLVAILNDNRDRRHLEAEQHTQRDEAVHLKAEQGYLQAETSEQARKLAKDNETSHPRRTSRKSFEPEMVMVPAGPFLMGSPKSDKLRFAQEPQQFELKLDYDYAIGKYPVTVGQYRAFIEAGGYGEDNWWSTAGWQVRTEGWDYVNSKWQATGKPWVQPRLWADNKWTGDDNLPVIGVSWYEAYAYTRWLAEATECDYRLLMEAEFEKAARGGLMIPDGKGGMKKNPNRARIWTWGDEEPNKELCNFTSHIGQTSLVTSHAAQAQKQPYGLYHMAGNVWEWCMSKWVDPYDSSEKYDNEGSDPRVVRGGSWSHLDYDVRCSCRFRCDPDQRDDFVGFRVAALSM